MNSKVCLLLATKLEAKPILSSGKWQRKEALFGVEVYSGSKYDLAITGIGPIKSALAVGCLLGLNYSKWINLGVAGSLVEGYEIGDVVEVGTCVSRDDCHPFDRQFDRLKLKSPGVTCVTVGKAVHDEEEKGFCRGMGDLVDMEAYSMALAAKLNDVELEVVKVISDNASAESVGAIVKAIPFCMEKLWKFIVIKES